MRPGATSMKRDIKGLEVIGACCSGCAFIFSILVLAPGWFYTDVWKVRDFTFLGLMELVCVLVGRTSVICRREGSLINFWSSSSCYCQSGCEMWQDHGQQCNVEICCIWNSFLFSMLLCELRGYDCQWSGGLNHILNLPKEDLLDLC